MPRSRSKWTPEDIPAAPRQPARSGIVRPEYYERYGWKRHNGDPISEALAQFCGSGRTGGTGKQLFRIERLVEVAEANGLAHKLAEWREGRGRPNGLLRMLLGAQLRTRWRYGHDVRIGDITVPGQPVEGGPRPVLERPSRSLGELVEGLAEGQGDSK